MARLVATCVVVLGVLLAGRAEACSCRAQRFAFEGSGVPRNAKLPLLGSFAAEETVSLADAQGNAVPATVEAVPGGLLLVPAEALAPDSGYVLATQDASFAFVTGNELDVAAPTAPRLTGSSAQQGVLFGTNCDTGGDGFVISLDRSGAPEPFEVLEVFTGPTVEGIDVSRPALLLPSAASFFLGDLRVCSWNFPTSTFSSLAVQVRARDAAGNVSELSNALQLKGVGCSAAPGAQLGLLGLALLLPFFDRRRRRATAAPRGFGVRPAP